MKQNVNEIWRDIPDYEGYYEVSNLGNVKGLDRTVLTKNGQERFYKGKIMKSLFNKDGYKQVNLSKNGKQEKCKIHKLVAMAFLGHIPNGFTFVVDHINGDKANNRVENLRIVTHRDNTSTCFRKDRNSLSSVFSGVHFCKTNNKWRADIRHKGKKIGLGRFDNEIDAAKAYKKALAELENGTFKIEDYRASFTSKYKSVYYYKNTKKWFAKPPIRGKRIYLGLFSTELEAHQAILEFEAIQPIEKL